MAVKNCLDPIQLFFGEVQLAKCLYILLNLTNTTRTDQCGCDFPSAEHPCERELSQALTTCSRHLIQRTYLAQRLWRNLRLLQSACRVLCA
ncbi:hypothetical protein D3C77_622600 [compost metagenome]